MHAFDIKMCVNTTQSTEASWCQIVIFFRFANFKAGKINFKVGKINFNVGKINFKVGKINFNVVKINFEMNRTDALRFSEFIFI